ncbi:Legumin type B [Euphorbia peplus]|nr:Legumin type B [Euphorbia peplus]
MAYFSMLSSSTSICCLLLLHGCVGVLALPKSKCQVIHKLIAVEPEIHIPSEGGSTEMWNSNSGHFHCAGVEVTRYTVKPNALYLPSYTNANKLAYIIQGNVMFGMTIPGCSQGYDKQKNVCQKIHHFQSGDVVAFRPGEIGWIYNGGNTTFIMIAIYDVVTDDQFRTFFLGGPQNMLHGFSSKLIAEAFNIDNSLARKLRKMDLRGSITYTTGGGLHLYTSPNTTRGAKISDPLTADLFIPNVGHFKTIDAHKLPILESFQLSVSYSHLLKDVMRLPHWENSYSLIYMVKGEGEIQVSNEIGNNVFHDIVKEGQLLVVPQNFVLTEKAKSEMFEYVSFKTNANPITSDLSGKDSVIYVLPSDVLTNAFKISEEEVKKIKCGRNEKSLAKIIPKYK